MMKYIKLKNNGEGFWLTWINFLKGQKENICDYKESTDVQSQFYDQSFEYLDKYLLR